MARRSSARLRSQNLSTPQRVSLSHDGPANTPRTAPVKLSALYESDEIPGAFPQSASPPDRATPSKQATTFPVGFGKTTPNHVTPIKPSEEDMHPAHHHQSTAKPLEEARWLGFANMGPHTEPPKHTSKIAALQGTPTKATKPDKSLESPKYQFTFRREQSLELSPEAKKLMNEKRDEAAKIRAQMIANGEGVQDVTEALGRRMATPKGKKSRFSEVHMEQFKKMDSIAGHASAFRADPNRAKGPTTPTQQQLGIKGVGKTQQTPSKSLKRSPSKAQLDETEYAPALSLPRSTSKPTLTPTGSHLPRPVFSNPGQTGDQVDSRSPAKRVKRSETEDVSAVRTSSNDDKTKPLTTPQQQRSVRAKHNNPSLASLASPTQAFLARVTSVKSSKVLEPSLLRSPSKSDLAGPACEGTNPPTPLLARSPSKASLFSSTKTEQPKATMSPFLSRSPLKGPSIWKVAEANEKGVDALKEAPLLTRSPLKMSVVKNVVSESAGVAPAQPSVPFLARSPSKISITQDKQQRGGDEEKETAAIPFLARAPMKIALPETINEEPTARSLGKFTDGSPKGRLNLLRASPMKSILRSPHRLYSDDPAKVAAGTHLATPPKLMANNSARATPMASPSGPATGRKRVDFSSSTKARYERAQSDEASVTPTKSPKKTGTTPHANSSHSTEQSTHPSSSSSITYPALPSFSEPQQPSTLTPQKRRQTATPLDFTFRAGSHEIIFGQASPYSPSRTPGQHTGTPTIRHVSAEPHATLRAPAASAPPSTPVKVTGATENTKKRKFAISSPPSAPETADPNNPRSNIFPSDATSDKENDKRTAADSSDADVADERPAKRVKTAPRQVSSPPQPPLQQEQQQPQRKRALTTGVHSKGVKGAGPAKDRKKRPVTTISQARLNALAQPKRRA